MDSVSPERLARMIQLAEADEQIIGERRNYRGSQYGYACDVVTALRELEASRRDAARYRFIRNQMGSPKPEEFDAAVDGDMRMAVRPMGERP